MMQYFNCILKNTNLFYKEPIEFDMNTNKNILSYSVGALLYISGIKENLLNAIKKTHASGANSIALCLEDSVSDDDVELAEENISKSLNQLFFEYNENNRSISIPQIFIRVRNHYQMKRILDNNFSIYLSGFIIPKFSSETSNDYFVLLKDFHDIHKKKLYVMPIIETNKAIFIESFVSELFKIREILLQYNEYILNIRIGGTDFSGLYGLRRSEGYTIYDIMVINSCLSSIINIFKRDDFIISGVVNEYYKFPEDYDNSSFVKECKLDKQNGLFGKTVIHPNQVNFSNALNIIEREEFEDALSIINTKSNGVIKSPNSNKMNEVKPHLKWANIIILKAKIWGVLEYGKSYRDVISELNKL